MSDKFINLGEIRSAVLNRCGFGGQGSAAGPIVNVVDEFIEDAYDVLFDLYEVKGRNQDFFITTAESQQWYDIPAGLDEDKIDYVGVLYSNLYIPIEEGITLDHESVEDIRHYPQRYDLQYNAITQKKQIKVWPEPDGIYSVKIRGMLDKADLVNDADIAYVDATMIKKYVTAHTKSHLGRKDAQIAMATLAQRIKQVKAKQHGNKRYVRGKTNTRPLPKPIVVDP